MEYQRFGDRFQLKFESGESVLETLTRFIETERIPYAAVSGLGAVRQVAISYWNAESREYETHELSEQLEVVSLIGNVAVRDGQPALHMHVSLGRRDLSLLGGHFNDAIVHPTLEIWLRREDEPVRRSLNEQTGLPHMNLPERL